MVADMHDLPDRTTDDTDEDEGARSARAAFSSSHPCDPCDSWFVILLAGPGGERGEPPEGRALLRARRPPGANAPGSPATPPLRSSGTPRGRGRTTRPHTSPGPPRA